LLHFRDLRLTTKLVLLVGTCLTAFAAFAALTYRTLEEVKVNGPVYERIVRGKDVIADVLPPPEYIIESYLLVLEMTEEKDPVALAQLIERSATLRREYDARHEHWVKQLPEGSLKTFLTSDSYQPARDFFAQRDADFIPAVRAGDLEKANRLALGPLKALYNQHRTAIDQVVSQATAENLTNEGAAADIISSRGTALALLGLVVVLVVIGIGVVTSRIASSLTRRIEQATVAASRVADGDLTVAVHAREGDETGRLLTAIATMTESLNALVARIKKSSIELLSTATQFAATSKQQEDTVNGFGASTNEIAAAVREISATSQELLGTMEGVNRVATDTAVAAEQGRSALSTMDGTMRGLARSTSSISSKLAVIREKAADINVVVTTITKVADQTNLLSVNAAIEAEKAGEYGLGFIVLAREIRRLADQTAVATLDIEQMVRQMQGAVSAGVMEMDKFTDEVRRGVDTAESIGGQLGQIITQVQSLTQSFESVAEAMRAQSTGAAQINDAMVQLTQGARATSASIREFDNATSHLREAVSDLKQEISHFKVSI
jgi:methyl-accepting chemotaxis protein WspA